MGLLDSLEGMAGHQEPDGGTQSKVATGLMQSLDEHPGGLAGVLDSFKRNGMEDHVQGWATGQQPSATPEQVQQGLGGTGLVERVAEKAGVSPQVAQVAMATVLPLVIAHFTQGGKTAAPQGGFGGMASQILGSQILGKLV